MSRFVTRKPPLIDESKQPAFVDTTNARDLSLNEVLPSWPTWEFIAVVGGIALYLLVCQVLADWAVGP